MRFDDTLDTVLAADVSTPFGKASAWRQLVDLIGRRRVPPERRALALLESIRAEVPLGVRAASARGLAAAQPPYVLVKLCAVDDITVAGPVLGNARLNSGEWIELLPRLSAAARTVVRARRDLPPGVAQALESFTVDFVIEGVVAAPEAAAEDALPGAEAVPAMPFAADADAATIETPVAADATDTPDLDASAEGDAPVDSGAAAAPGEAVAWDDAVAAAFSDAEPVATVADMAGDAVVAEPVAVAAMPEAMDDPGSSTAIAEDDDTGPVAAVADLPGDPAVAEPVPVTAMPEAVDGPASSVAIAEDGNADVTAQPFEGDSFVEATAETGPDAIEEDMAAPAPAETAEQPVEDMATPDAEPAPTVDPIAGWTEVAVAAAVPERRRFRLRPVMEPLIEPVVAPVTETAVEAEPVVAEAVEAAVEAEEPLADRVTDAVSDEPAPADVLADDPVPAPVAETLAPSTTFVTLGAAALSIPVVAAALQRNAAGSDSGVTQSETSDEPLAATALAPESASAHDSSMSGEDTILADRDRVVATGALRPEIAAVDATAPADGAALPPRAPEAEGPFEIADVVARIDAFYTRQQGRIAEAAQPARGTAFRFETDAQGVIRWVEGVSRAPLVGLSLDMTALPDGSRVDGVAAGAFRRRAGFSDARLVVAGDSDAAGDWRISATAAFDAATGRFSGYRGVARRPRAEEQPAPAPVENGAADSLRALMHELRTPTNAIAGFAEMIEREMLGEVPQVYRARAAAIRDHARALLAAIDDLDIAARIEASALRLMPGEVALRPMLARVADELGALAAMRGAWIGLPVDNLTVSADARATERMLARLLATLVSAAGEGERIEVRLAEGGDGMVAIAFTRPEALTGYADDEAMFGIDDEREDPALLGTGFALRLIRNLARELSGALVIEPDSLTVRLPAAVTKSLELMR